MVSDPKPGDLITQVPDECGNERVYLVLPDGCKLPLPFHYRVEEFALPGNLEIHNDGQVYALYDESTRTGAILSGRKGGTWTIWQPVTREQFFGQQVPGWLTLADMRAKWAGLL